MVIRCRALPSSSFLLPLNGRRKKDCPENSVIDRSPREGWNGKSSSGLLQQVVTGEFEIDDGMDD